MVDRVRALKLEDPATGTQTDLDPTEVNINEDYLDSRGVNIQNDSSSDEGVQVGREAATSTGLFKDGQVGTKTFRQLHNLPFNGNVITVDPTDGGADFTTIQAAVNAAVNGSIILIGPGKYPELIHVDGGAAVKDISLVSWGGLLASNFGGTNGNVTVNPVMSTDGDICFEVSGDIHLYVEGIDFRPTITAAGTYKCIEIGSSPGNRVFNNCGVRPSVGIGGSGDTIGVFCFSSSGSGTFFWNCQIRVADAVSQATTARGIDVTGGIIHFMNCFVDADLGAGDGDVRVGGTGDIQLVGCRVDGDLERNAGGTITVDDGTTWGGLVGFTDDDTETNLIKLEGGLLRTDGQNDLSKLFLRSLTADPGTLSNGMAWHRSDLNKLFARLNAITEVIALGAASSTDNALSRFNGTSGARLQNSGVTLSDLNEMRHAGTVEWDKGADIASAAALALGVDGNYFDVTGTTAITSVSAKPIGTRILLQFDDIVTVTHNATTLVLAGGVNFVTVAGDHLELVNYDGTNWREASRSTAPPAGGGDVTAAANIADNRMVRGDGGLKGIQQTGIAVSDNDEVRHAGTVEWDKGADIASVAALALGTDGNSFDVTGTTTITSVSVKPIGTVVVLQFDDVLTFTHNATTLVLAGATNFVTAAGNIIGLLNYDGTNWREIFRSVTPPSGGAPILSKTFAFENPTGTEDIPPWFTPVAITVTEIRAVVKGSSPSVTWTVRHGTDRSATGAEVVTGGTTTTSQTSGSDVTSFNDPTIVVDSFVWLETTAQTGTVDWISVTVVYTED